MCEIRVSLGSLAALAALLCVLVPGTPAFAFRQGIVELPQALANCCPKAHARVPSADEADRARLTTEMTVALTGQRTQGGANGISSVDAGLSLVPGQGGGRNSDRLTTRSFAPLLTLAEPAADAVPYKTVMISRGVMASVVLTSAAPNSWLGDVPAKRPATDAREAGLHVAAGGSTGKANPDPAKKPMVDDGKTDGGKTDGKQPTENGETPQGGHPPEFTGSAEQAEPDLDKNAEKNLIQGGWQ